MKQFVAINTEIFKIDLFNTDITLVTNSFMVTGTTFRNAQLCTNYHQCKTN